MTNDGSHEGTANSKPLAKQKSIEITEDTVFSWSRVTDAGTRERTIRGTLFGIAVGDAMGLAAESLSRRNQIRMFGLDTTRYRLIPGCGIVSDDTHLVCMAAQSICRSGATRNRFITDFRNRLAWYLVSLPVSAGRATLKSAVRCWKNKDPDVPTGEVSQGNGCLHRSLLLATVLQGSGVAADRWISASCKLTHNDPEAIDACSVVAAMGQLITCFSGRTFDPTQSINLLLSRSPNDFWDQRLVEIQSFLNTRRSVRSVAKEYGWEEGLPGTCQATLTMALYAFLRYPNRFRYAVERIIRLGGDTDSAAALVGGFTGALLGKQQIPPEWLSNLFAFPNNASWMNKMSDRLHYWPHGVDDIQSAPAMPTRIFSQLVRNGILATAVFGHIALRAPWIISDRALQYACRPSEPSENN